MKQFAIKQAMERVPGGMMTAPLLPGAPLDTVFPEAPKVFGSFTGALFADRLTGGTGMATALTAANIEPKEA